MKTTTAHYSFASSVLAANSYGYYRGGDLERFAWARSRYLLKEVSNFAPSSLAVLRRSWLVCSLVRNWSAALLAGLVLHRSAGGLRRRLPHSSAAAKKTEQRPLHALKEYMLK